ncbi:MAG: hypothetical protein OER92_02500 [Alphaproteobacteria bacterium]|nr:hypothetical protein [Alphaproteobacteria bacterium]
MYDDAHLYWLANELPARLAEAQVHQQSANQIRAEFFTEIVQACFGKLQQLRDSRLSRWISVAGW